MTRRHVERRAIPWPLAIAAVAIGWLGVHVVSGWQADRAGSVTVRVVEGITLKPIPAAVVQHVAPMSGPTVGPPPPLPIRRLLISRA